MIGMISFAMAFFWALPHVGFWRAFLFTGFCYLLFFPFEMIAGLPGMGIADGLAKLFPPNDKENPHLPSASELRSRSKWSCFVGGVLVALLGLWVLARLGAGALQVPMMVSLLGFEIVAYVDQVVHQMSAIRWPVLKAVAYSLAYVGEFGEVRLWHSPGRAPPSSAPLPGRSRPDVPPGPSARYVRPWRWLRPRLPPPSPDLAGGAILTIVQSTPGIEDAAAILRVSRDRMQELARSRLFPPPVVTLASGPIWLRASIAAYACDAQTDR